MSYDAYVSIDTGTGELYEIEEVGNYTSNVSKMYHLAMPGPYPGGGKYNGTGPSEERGGLPGISGLPCREAAGILRDGIRYMEDNAAAMRALEPNNGWGDYYGALNYLRHAHDLCIKHPAATLCVNW